MPKVRKTHTKKRPAAHVMRRPAACPRGSAGGVSPGGVDARQGSRHRLYPCCGKRKQSCTCVWNDLEARIRPGPWKQFEQSVAKCDLLTGRDTSDTGYFLNLYSGAASDVPLPAFWFMCVVYRRYSDPEMWEQLQGAISEADGQSPAWGEVQRALQKRIDEGKPIFGGKLYPSSLKMYRLSPTGPWMKCTNMTTPDRELISLKLMYKATPRKLLQAYDTAPSRDSWAQWYDAFMESMAGTTVGLFGPYSMKCALDVMVLCGRAREADLSRWPAECTGYSHILFGIFGKDLPQVDRKRAMDLIFRRMCQHHGGKLKYPEVLMHLCWNHRRATGVLKD